MNRMLIKADSTRGLKIAPQGSNLLFKERAKAEETVARLLADAERRAGEILKAAEEGVDQIRAEGLAEGRRRGYQEVAAQVAEAARLKNRTAEDCLPELAALASEMARRILSRELRTCPQDVARICARVIRENHCGRKLKVFVHPEDLKHLREKRHPVITDPAATVTFAPSNQVDRGGCVVRGELGQVDGRLRVQLEELTKVLKEG